jgi:hypothetical protein
MRWEDWRWFSLWRRCHGTQVEQSLLAAWPARVPPNWVERVNQADDGRETVCVWRTGVWTQRRLRRRAHSDSILFVNRSHRWNPKSFWKFPGRQCHESTKSSHIVHEGVRCVGTILQPAGAGSWYRRRFGDTPGDRRSSFITEGRVPEARSPWRLTFAPLGRDGTSPGCGRQKRRLYGDWPETPEECGG